MTRWRADGAGGRDAAFSAYMAARGPALLRTAYLLTGHHADAEDLVQTALARTYLAWDGIVDKGTLDRYVRRVLVNTRTDWWRSRRLDERLVAEPPDESVDDDSDRGAARDAVWSVLARLPRRQRAMVVLRFYEDLPEAEIADVLGVTLGTVKSTLSRALAKLRTDPHLRDALGD